MYHLKGSSVDPNRINASQSSGWFGQIIQRSDDGGKTWDPPGTKPEDLMGPDGMPKGESNMFAYEGAVGTHKFYDGSQHPWEFKRVCHLEPSLTDPDTVYVVPIKSDSEHFPPDGKLRVYRSRTGGNEWTALTNGLPQKDCYVNVLRGPIRDHQSQKRRPFVRFFACKEDLSLEPTDIPLPEAVANGTEPLLVDAHHGRLEQQPVRIGFFQQLGDTDRVAGVVGFGGGRSESDRFQTVCLCARLRPAGGRADQSVVCRPHQFSRSDD